MSAALPDPAGNAESEAQADAKAVSEALAEVELPSASERLAASREQLRQWMLQADGRQERRRRAEEAAAEGRSPPLMDRLRSMPMIGVIVDAVQAWWTHHPLQPAASLARGVVSERVAPIAARHPIAVIAGGFAVGVLLVRFKPWRWLLRPALFAGVTTQLIRRAIAAMPMESLIGAAAAFAQRRRHPDEPLAEETSATTSPGTEHAAEQPPKAAPVTPKNETAAFTS